MNDLELFKKEFDILLKNFLDEKIQCLHNYTKEKFVIDYVNHANKITLNGGKRVRPFIAYLSYLSFGGKEKEKIIKLLISLEIFHSFALIHDDIMDEETLRHNVITSHLYVANELKKRGVKNYKHMGNSQAILLGDLFFNWAAEIINLNSDLTVRKLFLEMAEGTIIGQMLDVESKSRKNITEDLIYEINYLKTAKYTFIYPLSIGASLAGNLTSDIKKFCENLGLNLGIAFQAQDDIFDKDSADKIQSRKIIIANNIASAKKLVKESNIEKDYKERLLEFINVLANREF
ncbi:MAG: polyprenyl synthetase family protein [bacterium]|nr:polyprenyl synthetase family protein [bacterium]